MSSKIPKRWGMEGDSFEAYTGKCDQTVDVHWHSHFLLHLITDGSGVQEINNVSYRVQRGSVILLSPMDFHRNVVREDEQISFCAIRISAELLYQSLKDLCPLNAFPLVTTLDGKNYETAKMLFRLLLDEQDSRARFGYERFSTAIIDQLIILALRDHAGGFSVPPTKMRNALLYAHCNFKSPIKATTVASHVGYSPNYFSAEFKRETGIEFRKYLQNLRLNFAMKLLKLSSLTVTEVCFESGFNSLPYFSQTFKKKFGVSPDQIKEKEICIGVEDV